MPNFHDLLQNVYDYFVNLNPRTANGGQSSFFAFERIGHPVSLSDFKLHAEDAAYSPEIAQERFSSLVNSMVEASSDTLSETLMKVDELYNMLLLGSSPLSADGDAIQFFANVKAQAKGLFLQTLRESMFLGGPEYHAAQASPGDWFDPVNEANWSSYSYTVASVPAPPSPPGNFHVSTQLATWKLIPSAQVVNSVLDTNPKLKSMVSTEVLAAARERTIVPLTARAMLLRPSASFRPAFRAAEAGPVAEPIRAAFTPVTLIDRVALQRVVSANSPTQPVTSTEFAISFKYCLVNAARAWIFEPFLTNASWYLPGSKGGAFSNGSMQGNLGVYPAMPVAFIAIKNLSISAQWSDDDLNAAKSSAGIGPFALESVASNASTHSQLSHDGIQIFGWTCQIMPNLPPVSDPAIS
jgi:hypothetical protein